MSEKDSSPVETPDVVKKEPVFSRRVNIIIAVLTLLRAGFTAWIYSAVDIGFGIIALVIGVIGSFVLFWVGAFVLTRAWKVVRKIYDVEVVQRRS